MKLISILISVVIHLIFIVAYLFLAQLHTVYKVGKKVYTVNIVQVDNIKKKTVIKQDKTVTKISNPKHKSERTEKYSKKHKAKPKRKNIDRVLDSMLKHKIEQIKREIQAKKVENVRNMIVRERIKALKQNIENTASKSANTEKSAYSYIQLIKGLIYSNWGVEKSLIKNNNYATDVDIRLDFKGDLVYIKIVRSSKNSYFDTTIIDAIRKSEPFPRPPGNILENGYVEFRITFDSREKK